MTYKVRNLYDELGNLSESQSESTRAKLADFESSNPQMQHFMQIVNRVAMSDSSLLILGETGVGKERLARAIHDKSDRRSGPFIAVNCAAFPESLLEAELFGHEPGAFTGAVGERRGYFELADGGTLFLDEIGEVHRYIQVKLLRVIQERCIQRLGSETQIPINVRIMSATNRDLKYEINEGRFRRDLYYRLGVVSLAIPSLRAHPEDILPLLQKYVEEFSTSLNRKVTGFSPEALKALLRYDWPGNVRELINVVERGVLLCSDHVIQLVDLPNDIISPQDSSGHVHTSPDIGVSLPKSWYQLPWIDVRKLILSQFESKYIRHHLQATRGKIGSVAKRTSLTQRAIHMMMKRNGMKKEDFRTKAEER